MKSQGLSARKLHSIVYIFCSKADQNRLDFLLENNRGHADFCSKIMWSCVCFLLEEGRKRSENSRTFCSKNIRNRIDFLPENGREGNEILRTFCLKDTQNWLDLAHLRGPDRPRCEYAVKIIILNIFQYVLRKPLKDLSVGPVSDPCQTRVVTVSDFTNKHTEKNRWFFGYMLG